MPKRKKKTKRTPTSSLQRHLRQDGARFRAQVKRETEEALGLPPAGTTFSVVTADPPWPYGDHLPGQTRGAAKRYRISPMEQIKSFLPDLLAKHQWKLADDCVLFLWGVEPMPQEALDTVAAWGFKFSTAGVWVKTTREPVDLTVALENYIPFLRGLARRAHRADELQLLNLVRQLRELKGTTAVLPTFPMGRTSRVCTERWLIGKRGRPEVQDTTQRNLLFAKVGEHSEKPEAFYERVEKLFKGPYLELYGRSERAGWTVIGDQMARGKRK